MRSDQKIVFHELPGHRLIPNLSQLARSSGYARATWHAVIRAGFLTLNNDGSVAVHTAREAMSHYRASLRAKCRARVIGRPFQREVMV